MDKASNTIPAASNDRPIGDLNVYCSGGTGINVAKTLEEVMARHATARIARVNVILVDTSASNLSGVKTKNVYLLKDVDGSGKVRGENSQLITNKALDILQKYPPAAMNMVVSSLSGGSGSVLAPSLLRELQLQDAMVIAVGIASTGSAIEVDNSIKTLKTYEAISKKTGKPVVMLCHRNRAVTDHSKVNLAVANEVVLTALVCSRQNAGLDTADLQNWLDYRKVSQAPAKLVGLEFRDSQDLSSEDYIPITIVSVAREGVDTYFPGVDHQSTGVVIDETVTTVTNDKPVHAVVVDGMPQRLAMDLIEIKKELDVKGRSRVFTSSILSEGGDEANDDGLVI